MTRYWCDFAWLADGTSAGRVDAAVALTVDADRITSVESDAPRQPDDVHLAGVTLPGLVNAHSHAFHRALRGSAQAVSAGRSGSFWSWREQMYAVAARLTPDTLFTLARATYAEMALAGITCVGEFHYLHHDERGRSYDDPNALGHALVAAAEAAGLRITLLDACYLTGGIGQPLQGAQLRFGDVDAAGWAGRVDRLGPLPPHARLGAAIHSVRAVPADQLAAVAGWATGRGAPLHVHLSEQPAENEACLAAYGVTPTQLLAGSGVLSLSTGPGTTAVHASHAGPADVGLLGQSGAGVCLCPTTERDLADGLGPGRALADAGCPLSVGSDSQAVIDLFEEARGVELHERLASGRRGHFTAAQLMTTASAGGAAALGWPETGRLGAGALADLVTVGLDTPRLAGPVPTSASQVLDALVFAATAADVREVLVGGRRVVRDGRHQGVPDVAEDLRRAVTAVLADR